MTSKSNHAHIIGLGLIGSSLALALRDAGWIVTGFDIDANVVNQAIELGIISSSDVDNDVMLIIIATPASLVADIANDFLKTYSNNELIVTDVAGVKASIASQVTDGRFLAGHPMAGSELRGITGARADLFESCTWVLSPTQNTSPEVYARLSAILREIGANVVAVTADDHDRLVAIASHVPHVVAGALMNHAAGVAEQDAVLLQLAAGGFRDMTRIAAGDATIWPDILIENSEAVVDTLNQLTSRLKALMDAITNGDRVALEGSLRSASKARRLLPGRALQAESMAFLRVYISDKPGQLALVTTLAAECGVNLYDIEIAHNVDARGGTLLLSVDETQAVDFTTVLEGNGFSVASQ